MKKQILLLVLASLLYSCSSPMDKKFNEKTAEEDIKAVVSEIDSSEMRLLVGSMMRLKLQDENIEEMTYDDILKKGKEWKAQQEKIEAEQKALAEKAAKKEAERIKKLREAVIVSCFEKGFSERDFQDYITYKFVIQNKSNKSIRAVKGALTFNNLFDDEIKSINFVYDQPIPAGKEVTWNATTDYNQFLDDDQTLKNKDLKDLKVVWEPEKVIFENGETLE